MCKYIAKIVRKMAKERLNFEIQMFSAIITGKHLDQNSFPGLAKFKSLKWIF